MIFLFFISLFIFFSLPPSFLRGYFFKLSFPYIIIFLLFFSSFAFAQDMQMDVMPNISSVATTMPKEENRKRQTLRLRYSHQHGNYLVFYDQDSIPVYLQYRWDRFDHTSDHIPNRIRRGMSYFTNLSLVQIIGKVPLPLSQALKQKNSIADVSQTSFRTREYKNIFVGILYRLDYVLPQQTRF